MRIVRPFLLATVLFAAPVGVSFAQGAPTKAGAKPAAAAPSTKASAAPTTKASATPTAAPTSSATPSAHDIQTEVDAAMSDKAQALFKEGNAFFRAGKYADAQASYKAAWALDLRSQRVVNNLGMTELELKLYRDAAEHLTIALRLADPNDPKKAKIQSNIDEARAKVGAITFKVNNDGAEVVHMETGREYPAPFVDPIFVEPGKSSFRIRREGFESQEKVFDLKAGEATSVEITLDRGKAYGGNGSPTATSTGTVSPPSEKRSRIPAFVLGGAGAAGLIAGGALIGMASGLQGQNRTDAPKDASGNPLCGRTKTAGEDAKCADLRSRADSINTLGNAGVGVLIGGGVLVAAAAVYLLLPSKKPSDTRSSQVIPVAGKDGAGLVWSGSF
ncbi:MAG: hypothetical protein U0441_13435 [Polyangiaceae bacterium]